MKIFFIVMSILVLVNSIMFILLKLHIYEYIYFWGFDIHFNHAGFDRDLLYYKFNSNNYKFLILYFSYINIPIIAYLLYKKIYSRLLLISMIAFSIFNITIVDHNGYVATKVAISKYYIRSFLTPSPPKDKVVLANDIKKIFYPSGELKIIEPQKNGVRKVFYKNGELRSEVKIVNGLKEGEYKAYEKNGTITRTTMYKNGKKNGIDKTFFDGKYAFFEYEYKNGEVLWEKHYYKEGGLEGEMSYIPFEDGSYGYKKTFYKSGELRFYGIFDESKFSMIKSFRYDKNGNITRSYKKE